MDSACADLERLPCLYSMQKLVLVRWACSEPRVGWLHDGAPRLPRARSALTIAVKGGPRALKACEAMEEGAMEGASKRRKVLPAVPQPATPIAPPPLLLLLLPSFGCCKRPAHQIL